MTQGRIPGFCTCYLCKRRKGNKRLKSTGMIYRTSQDMRRYITGHLFKQAPVRFRKLNFTYVRKRNNGTSI